MQMSFGSVILRALGAGLVGGVLLALYLWGVVEPKIDEAIALEEHAPVAEVSAPAQAASTAASSAPPGHEGHAHDHGAAETPTAPSQHGDSSGAQASHHEEAAADVAAAGHSHGHGEDALFSRSTQVVGGMIAALTYAIVFSLLFGMFFAATRHRFQGWSEMGRALWFAAVAFGTVALIPSLKYPANPPGVGDPATVDERGLMYGALLLLSVGIAVALTGLSGWLRRTLDRPTRVLCVAAATVVAYGGLLAVMPATPDTVQLGYPADLVWTFRIRSIGGLALMWTAIGVCFGWALERPALQREGRVGPLFGRA